MLNLINWICISFYFYLVFFYKMTDFLIEGIGLAGQEFSASGKGAQSSSQLAPQGLKAVGSVWAPGACQLGQVSCRTWWWLQRARVSSISHKSPRGMLEMGSWGHSSNADTSGP